MVYDTLFLWQLQFNALHAIPAATQLHAIASIKSSGPGGSVDITGMTKPSWIDHPYEVMSREGGSLYHAAFANIIA